MTSPSGAAPDPSAAVTRAIATANTPGAPDPSLAVLRAIQTATEHRERLTEVQLNVLRERINTVEAESTARREGLWAEVAQRLTDMDKANDLLASDLRKVPSDLQIAITSVKELEGVKFASIDSKFADNERQTAREKAAADLALAAAFDAQKEAAASTNSANEASIRKSEAATSDTIRTNAESQRAGQQSLSDKIDDAKDRMNRLESLIIAIQTERTTQHDGKVDNRSALNLGLAAMVVVLTIISTIAVVWGLTGR